MKRILAIGIFLIPTLAIAQGGFMDRLKKKVINKAEQKADQKVDKTIDKGFDKAEQAAKPGSKPADNTAPSKTPAATTSPAAAPAPQAAPDAPAAPALKSHSKFDFVPGEQIVYTENFEQDAIGELATGWNTTGTGEVVTLNNFPGKWFQVHQRSFYLTSNQKEFGENYTVEFDVIMQVKYNGHFLPYFSWGIISTNGEPSTGNDFLRNYRKYGSIETIFYPAEGGRSQLGIHTYNAARGYYTGDQQNVPVLSDFFGKPIHVAMQVQKERLRIWADKDKILDAPKAVALGTMMNQLFFEIHSSSYKEDQYGMFISNLKVAKGIPDTRHKLVEEGKFSTTGILFDVNSDVIRQESYGVLKNIADVLKENGDIKVKIIGHTDSDGEDKKNLDLSKSRAASVAKALQETFGIDAARLQTDGKGESVPVGDNKTKDGKALNRRVEFIKL
ncbi:OmpA family protein [Paraflavitalea sp. CAU 1676]|uniref:OmpA family protein n=1 Tax=Paraflavitalea sp. CAU 1676 TaxID=3032598 RepID=UPI0023DBD9BF|nr:OmpA family protein [Paraflavitalea sp. CAU 1676]MDF2188575.1 OmpA family protein [Paraflavitalea sp. CAU 1676]